MATTVEGEEPDTAPKNMLATSVVKASPPVASPTIAAAQLTIRWPMPPFFMMFAASTKKGTDSSENLSMPLNMFMATTMMSLGVKRIRLSTVGRHSATKMGAPKNSITNMLITKKIFISILAALPQFRSRRLISSASSLSLSAN